jgi:hypothetical protein
LPACRPPANTSKTKRILTTFTVLQDMAQNVAGTNAVVESITKPGAEIHEYEPTPLDIVKAQSADLVLWNGLGLERWFEKFFGNVKAVPGAVLTEGTDRGSGAARMRVDIHAASSYCSSGDTSRCTLLSDSTWLSSSVGGGASCASCASASSASGPASPTVKSSPSRSAGATWGKTVRSHSATWVDVGRCPSSASSAPNAVENA